MRYIGSVAISLIGLCAMSSASIAETVNLYAAGSLREAFTKIARTFESKSGHTVALTFGPSGLLRERIEAGASAHVFGSADMGHPQKLSTEGKGGEVTRFASNRLCALVRDGFSVTSETLLAKMLDPGTRVATSTPKDDPSGDYAFALFAKAENIRPGARSTLEAKALQLVGSSSSATPPAGRSAYAWNLAEGRADIFLAYCTAAVTAQAEVPSLQIVQIPAELAVAADYGLIVMNDAPVAARALAGFILGTDGQSVLQSLGFGPR